MADTRNKLSIEALTHDVVMQQNIASTDLPISIQQFIESEQWTYAKTMPDWPHEYLVRNRVDENLFMQFVQHIWNNGYVARFYDIRLTYYDYDGRVYWTMSEPDDQTMILNRCMKDDTYESRLKDGTLPK